MSLYLFMSAISSAIGEAFVCKCSFRFCHVIPSARSPFDRWITALSADPLLVWNYGVMGTLAFVVGWIFWWSMKDLDAQEDELNSLAEGHVQLISPDEKASR
jgi:POT family proton-dependent oligopeptide transporter